MSSHREIPYARRIAERRSSSDDLYMHLGHWDDPSSGDDLAVAQRALDERVAAMAGTARGDRILDVACGLGGTLARLAQTVPDAELIGLNADAAQLEVAARSVSAPVSWLVGDACAMPIGDGSVDRVLCVEAAFHFASRRAFYREVARVLRPGGRYAMSDIVPGPGLAELRAERGREIEATLAAGVGAWPDFWGNDADPRELAPAAGLVVDEWFDATAHTAPSYDFFLGDGPAREQDPVVRATALLAELHRLGHLRVIYLAGALSPSAAA